MEGPTQDLKGREMPENGRVQKGILKRLRIQTFVALALVFLSLPFGTVAAYSSLFGSIAVFVPGLLFTVLVTMVSVIVLHVETRYVLHMGMLYIVFAAVAVEAALARWMTGRVSG